MKSFQVCTEQAKIWCKIEKEGVIMHMLMKKQGHTITLQHLDFSKGKREDFLLGAIAML